MKLTRLRPGANLGASSRSTAMPSAIPDTHDYSDLSFQAIVEQAIVGVYVIQDECFVYSNATFAGFFGMTQAEFTGISLRKLIPAYFLEQSLDLFRKRITGEMPSVRYISPGYHVDGHIVQVEVHGTRMTYQGRPAIVGVGIDATERVHREAELRQARADLQDLAAAMNRDREAQRAKFARELHDVLGGLLASIKMDAKRIRRRTVDDAELTEITSALMAVTQEAIQTVREMSEEMRPSGLDHLGLCTTIRRELRQFAARYDVDCVFDASPEVDRLVSLGTTSVYRIFQEAMTNVAKHSKATRIDVRLAHADGEFVMEVRDNGTGLQAAAPRATSRGVLGMKERARDLGGSLSLDNAPDGGACLRLVVPAVPEAA